MDQSSQITDSFPNASHRAPQLTLVASRFRLAQPGHAVPEDWQAGIDGLLTWLGIDAEYAPAARGRLPRMAEWALAGGQGSRPAPVFAPWIGWSPAAFQHGGLPGLPEAQFVASYLIEHARGCAPGQSGIDVVLMSPHPATCIAEEAGSAPLPRAAVMKAMLRTARAEGRERVAIILHARQRNALARQLLAAGKGLTREGLELDILTIEDALAPLMSGRAPWDAIIAMPDVRSIIFTLLAEASGVRKAWPMLWFAQDHLRLVTSETPGEAMTRSPLDAPALIHALALTLHEAGAGRAAWRLHDAWSRLRDSGVTTTGRGGDAPYAKEVRDSEFLALLGQDSAASRRPQQGWRALKFAQNAIVGSQVPGLRVVS